MYSESKDAEINEETPLLSFGQSEQRPPEEKEKAVAVLIDARLPYPEYYESPEVKGIIEVLINDYNQLFELIGKRSLDNDSFKGLLNQLLKTLSVLLNVSHIMAPNYLEEQMYQIVGGGVSLLGQFEKANLKDNFFRIISSTFYSSEHLDEAVREGEYSLPIRDNGERSAYLEKRRHESIRLKNMKSQEIRVIEEKIESLAVEKTSFQEEKEVENEKGGVREEQRKISSKRPWSRSRVHGLESLSSTKISPIMPTSDELVERVKACFAEEKILIEQLRVLQEEERTIDTEISDLKSKVFQEDENLSGIRRSKQSSRFSGLGVFGGVVTAYLNKNDRDNSLPLIPRFIGVASDGEPMILTSERFPDSFPAVVQLRYPSKLRGKETDRENDSLVSINPLFYRNIRQELGEEKIAFSIEKQTAFWEEPFSQVTSKNAELIGYVERGLRHREKKREAYAHFSRKIKEQCERIDHDLSNGLYDSIEGDGLEEEKISDSARKLKDSLQTQRNIYNELMRRFLKVDLKEEEAKTDSDYYSEERKEERKEKKNEEIRGKFSSAKAGLEKLQLCGIFDEEKSEFLGIINMRKAVNYFSVPFANMFSEKRCDSPALDELNRLECWLEGEVDLAPIEERVNRIYQLTQDLWGEVHSPHTETIYSKPETGDIDLSPRLKAIVSEYRKGYFSCSVEGEEEEEVKDCSSDLPQSGLRHRSTGIV